MVEKQDVLAHCGLTLSRNVLRRLDKVVGGRVREIGRYGTFCGPDGESLRISIPSMPSESMGFTQ
jgi:hypothetical protein